MFKRDFLTSSEESENQMPEDFDMQPQPQTRISKNQKPQDSGGNQKLTNIRHRRLRSDYCKFTKPSLGVASTLKNPDMLPIPAQAAPKPQKTRILIQENLDEIVLGESSTEVVTPPGQVRASNWFNQPQFTPHKTYKHQQEEIEIQQKTLELKTVNKWLNQQDLTLKSKNESISQSVQESNSEVKSEVVANNWISSEEKTILGQVSTPQQEPEIQSPNDFVPVKYSPPIDTLFFTLLTESIISNALLSITETKCEVQPEQQKKSQISAKNFISVNVRHFKQILVSPVAMTFNCTIKRDKSGLSGKLWGKYYMFLDDGWIFMLGATKRKWNKTPNYMITNKYNNFDKNSPDYLGKVRGNFAKTQYAVFNRGCNPKKRKLGVQIRQEIAKVVYVIITQDSVMLENSKIRTIKGSVIYPVILTQNNRTEFVSRNPRWDHSKLHTGNNRQSIVWNNSRAEISVKNFQLVDSRGNLLLEFVKVAEDHYGLEIRWPLSPLQAMALALTSLDK